MNRRLGFPLALVVAPVTLAAVILFAINAYGFTIYTSKGLYKPVSQLSGSDVIVKWTASDRPVEFKINPAGMPSGSVSSFEAAMAEWNRVSSSDFVFTSGGTSTSTAFSTNNGVNLVDFGKLPAEKAAITTIWSYSSGPSDMHIVDTDIRLNSNFTWYNNANPYPAGVFDVQSILTHELGHTLILGHSANSNATMFLETPLSGDNSWRSLHSDDMAGITYLYPTAGNSPPSAPVLEYPLNSQTGVSQALTFKWKAASDPDGDTLKYAIYYCENAGFSGCTSNSVTSASTGMASAALPITPKSGGESGLYAAFLSAFGLLLVTGLRRKKTKALAMSLALFAAVALLSCGGGGPSSSSSSSSSGSSGNGGSAPATSYSASGLKAATKYYWKVAANDLRGGVTESAVWSFTTQ